MVALVTVPVAGSTVTTQTPFPLRLRRFISYVYSGKGAVIAMDWATESETGTGSEMLAATGCTADRCRFLGRGFLSEGAATTSGSSAGDACSVGAAGFGLRAIEAALRLGSDFFSSGGAMFVGVSSAVGICSGTGAASSFGAVATVDELDSVFFFFGF